MKKVNGSFRSLFIIGVFRRGNKPPVLPGDNKKSGARKEKGELDASPKKTKRKEEPRV